MSKPCEHNEYSASLGSYHWGSLHVLVLGIVILALLESIVKEVDISLNLSVHEISVNLA